MGFMAKSDNMGGADEIGDALQRDSPGGLLGEHIEASPT